MSPPRIGVAVIAVMLAGGEVRCDPTLSCSSRSANDAGLAAPLDAGVLACESGCEVTAVAAGGRHTCAVVRDGETHAAFCWGENDEGQLGPRVSAPEARTPMRIPGVGDVLDVAASELLSCLRTTLPGSGGVWLCAGRNARGMLGTDPHTRLDLVGSRFERQLIRLGTLHLITAGAWLTGDLSHGQGGGRGAFVGGEWSTEYTTIPIRLSIPVSALGGVAGGLMTCFLDEGGAVRCAGEEGLDGRSRSRFELVAPLLAGFVAVDLGLAHGCAVHSGGELWCWGRGLRGELGRGELGLDDRGAERVVLEPVVAVACGGGFDVTVHDPLNVELSDPGRAHTCAITEDGALYCWGANEHGQLGDGTREDRSRPVLVDLTGPVTRVALGSAHTCAIAGGALHCWGDDSRGQLGVGDGGSVTPRRVPLR